MSSGREPGLLQHLSRHVFQAADGHLKEFVAAHLDVVRALFDRLAGSGHGGAAGGNEEVIGVLAFGVQLMRQDSRGRLDRPEHCRRHAVAEDDAGGAVLVIEVTRKQFGPDHQHVLGRRRCG